MQKNSMWAILVSVSIGCVILLIITHWETETKMMNRVYTMQDITSLFRLSINDIKEQVDTVIQEADKVIERVIATPAASQSYDTIVRPLDELVSLSNYSILSNILNILEMVSTDEAIRTICHEQILKLHNFAIDRISNNKQLYETFKTYASNKSLQEKLSVEQNYFIQETLNDFERMGLALPQDELTRLTELRKEIAKLSLEFERNIAQDNSFIIVAPAALDGLSDDAINRLSKSDDGLYILGVDYPTVDAIMQNCRVEDTRKKLFIAFNNRAYPANEKLLISLLNLRDDLAQLLGYSSYAEYDLGNQMVLTPHNATQFLYDLLQHSTKKVEQEYALLTQELPPSVSLLKDGKIKPWDGAFLKESYKKKHFSIDQEQIAEYFPLEKTIDGLLQVYELFLDITLKKVPVNNVWYSDVQAVQVYSKPDNQLLGTLFLDLHPRDNKYKHACQSTIVPAVIQKDGSLLPGVCVVLANFPKSTAEKPALLKLNDVSTFFHEFGHALHTLLGATTIAALSGTNTKTDFVELPSQMLEEWLWDKEILIMVSSHYISGESLPVALIDTIIALKNFDSGSFVQRQAFLSLLCLEYYRAGKDKDPYAIMKQLHEQTRPQVAFEPDDHFYAAYGHLPSYAAKYYGYLWSRVFALDIFGEIKKEGLLNPVAGKKYVDTILSRGGVQDPNELLFNYLGRKPNNRAFLQEMGLAAQEINPVNIQVDSTTTIQEN